MYFMNVNSASICNRLSIDFGAITPPKVCFYYNKITFFIKSHFRGKVQFLTNSWMLSARFWEHSSVIHRYIFCLAFGVPFLVHSFSFFSQNGFEPAHETTQGPLLDRPSAMPVLPFGSLLAPFAANGNSSCFLVDLGRNLCSWAR